MPGSRLAGRTAQGWTACHRKGCLQPLTPVTRPRPSIGRVPGCLGAVGATPWWSSTAGSRWAMPLLRLAGFGDAPPHAQRGRRGGGDEIRRGDHTRQPLQEHLPKRMLWFKSSAVRGRTRPRTSDSSLTRVHQHCRTRELLSSPDPRFPQRPALPSSHAFILSRPAQPCTAFLDRPNHVWPALH